MTAPLLEATALNAHYGRAQILFDVDLAVGEGEVVVLLGRNGAGKTTTLKTLMGLVPASGGEIRFGGQVISGLAPHEIARLGIGFVPEDRRIFADLTVDENLEVGRRPPLPGRRPWSPERLVELFPNLAGLRRRRAGYTSGGEQQMLTIARTLMGNPRLMLVDEPAEGLAPVVVEQLVGAIAEMKAGGVSLLLSEQNAAFGRAVVDRAYVIESGQIRFRGSLAALTSDDAARREWLGV